MSFNATGGNSIGISLKPFYKLEISDPKNKSYQFRLNVEKSNLGIEKYFP